MHISVTGRWHGAVHTSKRAAYRITLGQKSYVRSLGRSKLHPYKPLPKPNHLSSSTRSVPYYQKLPITSIQHNPLQVSHSNINASTSGKLSLTCSQRSVNFIPCCSSSMTCIGQMIAVLNYSSILLITYKDSAFC